MMLPPYTSSNPILRKTQIVTLTMSLALRYYRFIINQCGGCPGQILGSSEPATAKTTTALLAQKIFSDISHFLAPNSTPASINQGKSVSSMTWLIDDMESAAMRHQVLMDSYNGASKTTIGRGEEKKLGGQMMTLNFKNNEKLEEKLDEGRVFIHL